MPSSYDVKAVRKTGSLVTISLTGLKGNVAALKCKYVHYQDSADVFSTVRIADGKQYFALNGTRFYLDTCTSAALADGYKFPITAQGTGNPWEIVDENGVINQGDHWLAVGTNTEKTFTLTATKKPQVATTKVYVTKGDGISSYYVEYYNSSGTLKTEGPFSGNSGPFTVKQNTTFNAINITYINNNYEAWGSSYVNVGEEESCTLALSAKEKDKYPYTIQWNAGVFKYSSTSYKNVEYNTNLRTSTSDSNTDSSIKVDTYYSTSVPSDYYAAVGYAKSTIS